MRWEALAIATITWARDPDEERLLRASLVKLSEYGRPMAVADAGSGQGFMSFLQELPGVTVVAPEQPGLVAQTRASLKAALTHGCEFLLYTEPDKLHFFESALPAFVGEVPQVEGLGVCLAARTPASLATFPATQQLTETAINALFAREVGLEADFCYGPLIINRRLVPLLESVDAGMGWGWRFWLMGAAQRAGYRLHAFEADLPCPPGQGEDHRAERIHRMRQLGQNLQGLIQVLQGPDRV